MPSKDLDGGASTRRCREHSDVLVEELELGILWDEYGLVDDVVVNIFVSLLFLFFLSLGPVLLGYEGMELIPLPIRCTMHGSSGHCWLLRHQSDHVGSTIWTLPVA